MSGGACQHPAQSAVMVAEIEQPPNRSGLMKFAS